MNKDSLVLPPRWQFGCWALFVSGFLYSNILKKVVAGIGWLFQNMESLQPVTAASLEVVAVILLVPLVVTTLIYLFNDWRETLTRVIAFWLKGFKVSVIGLLLILPFLLGGPIFKHLKAGAEAELGSVGRWLFLLVVLAFSLLSPFWAWAVIRRLPQTFLGRDLFDDSDLNRIEQEIPER